MSSHWCRSTHILDINFAFRIWKKTIYNAASSLAKGLQSTLLTFNRQTQSSRTGISLAAKPCVRRESTNLRFSSMFMLFKKYNRYYNSTGLMNNIWYIVTNIWVFLKNYSFFSFFTTIAAPIELTRQTAKHWLNMPRVQSN